MEGLKQNGKPKGDGPNGDDYRKQALRRKPNYKALGIGASVMAAAAIVFALWKGGPEGPCEDHPTPPTRGDHICPESEIYPYMLNPDNTVRLDDEGNPIPNPYYSKEDCYVGDGVCDRDPDNLRDPAGNPVTLMEGFTFLPETADPNVNPLEDGMVFSLDCAMLDCSSDPDAPVLQRATITMNTKVKVVTLNPDTGEAELVQVKLNPYLGFTPLTWDEENQQCNPLIEARRVEDGVVASESRRKFYMPSWTPFRRMRTYVETNNSSLEVCGPLTDGECFCPNLREFHREEPVCGDGQITGPEECDTRSARPNRGCDRNEVCNTVEDQRRGRGKACTCRDKRPPPPPPPEEVCGDGQITGREPCDTRSDRPRGGCQEGHHCVEQANRCSCQRDAPPQLSECATGTGGRRASRLEERVQEKVLGHGHTIRNTHLGAPGSTRVGFSAIATISGDGDVTFRPPVARVTCLGPCSKTRRISGQALLGITGALGLHGKTVDAPQDRNACRWVISFPINAGQ